ncbi:hypothetical protein OUZ56_022704 [Daphnia magna]|uniref:Uncharacterized protein n=1 Tax=Daphnia magna TaxID=35525 RepID=A0ABR0AXB2_9CRUS|nr:hypothetical protein OUZ56_022704 [Daphnia magna]
MKRELLNYLGEEFRPRVAPTGLASLSQSHFTLNSSVVNQTQRHTIAKWRKRVDSSARTHFLVVLCISFVPKRNKVATLLFFFFHTKSGKERKGAVEQRHIINHSSSRSSSSYCISRGVVRTLNKQIISNGKRKVYQGAQSSTSSTKQKQNALVSSTECAREEYDRPLSLELIHFCLYVCVQNEDISMQTTYDPPIRDDREEPHCPEVLRLTLLNSMGSTIFVEIVVNM